MMSLLCFLNVPFIVGYSDAERWAGLRRLSSIHSNVNDGSIAWPLKCASNFKEHLVMRIIIATSSDDCLNQDMKLQT